MELSVEIILQSRELFSPRVRNRPHAIAYADAHTEQYGADQGRHMGDAGDQKRAAAANPRARATGHGRVRGVVEEDSINFTTPSPLSFVRGEFPTNVARHLRNLTQRRRMQVMRAQTQPDEETE